MIKFKYVEDYLEYIAGLRDDLGQPLNFFQRQPVRINLARYDVNIVDSLAYQTADMNTAYTDKQSELAVKIVVKYRKQLANLSKPVLVPEDNFIFRLGIRHVDRSKKIYLENNELVIKFPFDHKIIEDVKAVNKILIGSIIFDREHKVWRYGLTEHTITFAITMGEKHGFEIDSSVLALHQKIETMANGQPYKIQLRYEDNELQLENAAQDLKDYIKNSCGGLSKDNLTHLIDQSAVLGYSLHSDILNWMNENIDPGLSRFMLERMVAIEKTDDILDDILHYARLTNRLPIHVYDTGLPKKDCSDIIYLNNKRNNNVDLNSMKLLVTYTPILMGGRKATWLHNAEKVIIIK